MGGLVDPEKELGMNDSVQENRTAVAVRVCMLTQHTATHTALSSSQSATVLPGGWHGSLMT